MTDIPTQTTVCPVCGGKGAWLHDSPTDNLDEPFWVNCSVCKGTGRVEVDTKKKCSGCNGEGTFLFGKVPCGCCHGSGVHEFEDGDHHREDECTKCNGIGEVEDKQIRNPVNCFDVKTTTKLSSSVYQRAINVWGREAQLKMAIEECGELIVKLVKLNRYSNGSTQDEVINEIADVKIMMEQLTLIFGPNLVEDKVKEKLARLRIRLDYSENTA